MHPLETLIDHGILFLSSLSEICSKIWPADKVAGKPNWLVFMSKVEPVTLQQLQALT